MGIGGSSPAATTPEKGGAAAAGARLPCFLPPRKGHARQRRETDVGHRAAALAAGGHEQPRVGRGELRAGAHVAGGRHAPRGRDRRGPGLQRGREPALVHGQEATREARPLRARPSRRGSRRCAKTPTSCRGAAWAAAPATRSAWRLAPPSTEEAAGGAGARSSSPLSPMSSVGSLVEKGERRRRRPWRPRLGALAARAPPSLRKGHGDGNGGANPPRMRGLTPIEVEVSQLHRGPSAKRRRIDTNGELQYSGKGAVRSGSNVAGRRAAALLLLLLLLHVAGAGVSARTQPFETPQVVMVKILRATKSTWSTRKSGGRQSTSPGSSACLCGRAPGQSDALLPCAARQTQAFSVFERQRGELRHAVLVFGQLPPPLASSRFQCGAATRDDGDVLLRSPLQPCRRPLLGGLSRTPAGLGFFFFFVVVVVIVIVVVAVGTAPHNLFGRVCGGNTTTRTSTREARSNSAPS